MSAQSSFVSMSRNGGRGALVTAISGPLIGQRLFVAADGERLGGFEDPAVEQRALAHAEELMWAERSELRDELFVDITAPPPRVLIFGAVEYAARLSHLASVTGWRAYVIDPRAQFATSERFPDAAEVVVAWPREALDRLGGIDRQTYIAVLTHDPKIDDEVLVAALEGEPAYIGAMGSKRAQEKRRERLLALGVGESSLKRISAPIGLDLGGAAAEEVAVAIMGELLAARYGRDGGRLSSLNGARIH